MAQLTSDSHDVDDVRHYWIVIQGNISARQMREGADERGPSLSPTYLWMIEHSLLVPLQGRGMIGDERCREVSHEAGFDQADHLVYLVRRRFGAPSEGQHGDGL